MYSNKNIHIIKKYFIICYNISMEEYIILKEHFTTLDDFLRETEDVFIDFIQDNGQMYPLDAGNDVLLETLCLVLFKVIYEYYKRDKVAYLDVDHFIERLCHEVALNFAKYIVKYNVNNALSRFSNQSRYDDISITSTENVEKGVSASSVVQSTASTPTGVSTTGTSKTISIDKSYGMAGELDTSSTIDTTTSGYVDKYTNFQGKTNGLHDNDVHRQGNVMRKGKLSNIIELQNMLPQSLYDEVLRDVSYNFIILYE